MRGDVQNTRPCRPLKRGFGGPRAGQWLCLGEERLDRERFLPRPTQRRKVDFGQSACGHHTSASGGR